MTPNTTATRPTHNAPRLRTAIPILSDDQSEELSLVATPTPRTERAIKRNQTSETMNQSHSSTLDTLRHNQNIPPETPPNQCTEECAWKLMTRTHLTRTQPPCRSRNRTTRHEGPGASTTTTRHFQHQNQTPHQHQHQQHTNTNTPTNTATWPRPTAPCRSRATALNTTMISDMPVTLSHHNHEHTTITSEKTMATTTINAFDRKCNHSTHQTEVTQASPRRPSNMTRRCQALIIDEQIPHQNYNRTNIDSTTANQAVPHQ